MIKASENGRVVFVTGAAGGLGTALVSVFQDQGWTVLAGYRKNPPALQERIVPIQLDVTSNGAILEVAGRIETEFGHLDALINNAGIIDDDLLTKMSENQFDSIIETNLKAVFRCCKGFSQLLQKTGGHIINIGSFVGRHGAVGQSNYAASKAGLIGLSLSVAREFAKNNVRVNTIFPGVLKTNMTAHFQEEQWARFNESNVLGRTNNPAEIARFIQFLCSTENISGQVFALDSRIGSWC